MAANKNNVRTSEKFIIGFCAHNDLTRIDSLKPCSGFLVLNATRMARANEVLTASTVGLHDWSHLGAKRKMTQQVNLLISRI